VVKYPNSPSGSFAQERFQSKQWNLFSWS